MIPPETIDRVFSAAKIEEVVGDYVSLKKRGANLIGLCPFHDEKTGSFTVSPSKGIYKCFGCGKSGHAVGFVMEIEQCSYVEAVKTIAKKYGIVIEERELSKEEQQVHDDRESMFVVNEWSNKWFQNQLWETPEGKAIGLSYLRERGLRDDTIHKFNIGYSPDKNLLSKEAVQHGFAEKYLVNDPDNAPYWGTGVCLKSSDGRLYDRFHSRVIFPFFSASGKVIGFAGRIMKQNDKVGKYVNSPTSPVFEKHDCLYGLFQAKQHIVRLNRCYLVEGQMDVISMYQAGIQNVVASGGTSLTKPQIRLIHRFTDNITVLYDGDKAGIKAALRGIDMILEEGISVKVLLLPDGEDPDSFAKSHTVEEFMNYIDTHQRDFIEYKIQLLSEDIGKDPKARQELIKSMVQSLSSIPDKISRIDYIKKSAELLAVEGDVFMSEVVRLRKEKLKKEYQEKQNDDISDTESDIEEAAKKIIQQSSSLLNDRIFDLIKVVIRYGEKQIGEEDGKPICVGEYIINEINNDGIAIQDSTYQQIVTEFMANYRNMDFIAETYFIYHSNADISHLAIETVNDPYNQLQPEEDLLETVQKLLLALKETVVDEKLDAIRQNLKNAGDDFNIIRALMIEQTQYLQIKKQIKDALGRI